MSPKNEMKNLSELRFDKNNPRIITTTGDKDRDIIKKLHTDYDLREILNSMAMNGYMDIEPLIVEKDGNAFTVLEGNRRLAALMLFNNPALATELKIEVPSPKPEFTATLQGPFSVRIDTRENARAYIGFKHINGPHKWASYAKGKYALTWYREKAVHGLTVQDIATKIGDSHDTVKKMIKACMVLEQAIAADVFSLDDKATPSFAFSHFYTALARSTYREFLGLEQAWHQGEPYDNAVPREKIENLGKVLDWLYGSKSRETRPVIKSQNPDLRRLGDVIVNKPALMILESERNLDAAYKSLPPADQQFAFDLTRAHGYLKACMSNMSSYSGGFISVGETIFSDARVLVEYMRANEGGPKSTADKG